MHEKFGRNPAQTNASKVPQDMFKITMPRTLPEIKRRVIPCKLLQSDKFPFLVVLEILSSYLAVINETYVVPNGITLRAQFLGAANIHHEL